MWDRLVVYLFGRCADAAVVRRLAAEEQRSSLLQRQVEILEQQLELWRHCHGVNMSMLDRMAKVHGFESERGAD